MLMSVGKLSPNGEMLTIRLAASKPPGDRQSRDFESTSVCFQLGGTVHDMPCWSHFTVWPPASAAVCAAVGFACSTSPPLVADFELLLEVPELVLVLNLLVRLQRDNARPRTSSTGICFMGTLATKRLEEQPASMRKTVHKSMPAATCYCRTGS